MSSESISIKSSKNKSKWVCRDCGYESTRYLGRCVFCNSWGTMQEVILSKKSEAEASPKHGIFVTPESELLTLAEIPDVQVQRYQTGFGEFDRTLGGGVVPGSLTLIGGNPGVGKSTLLLQVAAKLGLKVLYVSAEESSQQLKIRASRLGLLNESKKNNGNLEASSVNNILVFTENNLEKIVSKIKETEAQLVIIDSIQAIYLPKLDSIPGSVSQIREVTSNLMRLAKSTGVSIMIVGHITKEGDIAGPKILEHMVDTVLQFEGEKDQSFRILRSIKNRFGSTDEVGIFDMSSEGLQDITNPSELFLKQRSGGIVVATREGKRSLLLELQSLVVNSEYNNPRRLANGIELSRLHQILAVLEKKIGLSVARSDVYLNVVGGLNIREPAADLAVALSIYINATDLVPSKPDNSVTSTPQDSRLPDVNSDSSEIRKPCPQTCQSKNSSGEYLNSLVALGEIGLSGELRAISNLEARLKEAEKLGFTKAIVPSANLENVSKTQASLKNKYKNLELIPVKTLRGAIDNLKSLF